MPLTANYRDDRDLMARQHQLAARSGLLSQDTESGDHVKVVGVSPSLVENELYPWDPAVVRAIRRLDPLVVPIGVKYICRTPASTEFMIYRHALGRMLPPTPEGRHGDHVMNVVLPASPWSLNTHVRHPMIWLDVLEYAEDPRYGLPPGVGPYKPFDWRLFYNSREEERDPATEARERAEQRAVAKAYHETKAKNDHNDSWDQEWGRIQHYARKLDVRERANIHQPIEPEIKPFVQVKGA